MSNSSETTGAPAASRPLIDWLHGQLRNMAPFVTLLFLVVFFSLASPSFPTLATYNILTQVSITGIIAVGLTFVILCAEIDLSVASDRQRHRHRGRLLHAAGGLA